MAKAKPDTTDVTIDSPTTVETPVPIPNSPEALKTAMDATSVVGAALQLEKYTALIAKIEAENAELKAMLEAATQPLPPIPPAPAFERYAVSVPGHSHARRVVSAGNPGQAVEVYMASMGILSLPAGPLVEPTDEPTWNGE